MEVTPPADLIRKLGTSQAAKNTDEKSVEVAEQDSTTTSTTPKDVDSFVAFLQKSLGKSGSTRVHEEELFSSIISQRLEQKSPEALAHYQKMVSEYSSKMAREDGWVPVEDVAKLALKSVVSEGLVTNDDAEMINSEAFQGAQLDDNLEMLFDDRGTTSATLSADEAMFKVKEFMSKVDKGEIKIEARSLDIPSNQGAMSGKALMTGGQAEGTEGVAGLSGGEGSEKQIRFTWKHEASDGNLAILLPTRLNGLVKSVKIYNDDGKLVETGDYSKQTGDSRAVYRFNEPGGEYGKNVDVVVALKSGEELVYHVKNGGERTYVPQDDFKLGFNSSGAIGSTFETKDDTKTDSSDSSSSSSSSSSGGSVPPPSNLIGNPAVT